MGAFLEGLLSGVQGAAAGADEYIKEDLNHRRIMRRDKTLADYQAEKQLTLEQLRQEFEAGQKEQDRKQEDKWEKRKSTAEARKNRLDRESREKIAGMQASSPTEPGRSAKEVRDALNSSLENALSAMVDTFSLPGVSDDRSWESMITVLRNRNAGGEKIHAADANALDEQFTQLKALRGAAGVDTVSTVGEDQLKRIEVIMNRIAQRERAYQDSLGGGGGEATSEPTTLPDMEGFTAVLIEEPGETIHEGL
jgi:hypothetical protein